jgi:RNA polymerase sigma-70 factor (ECF subfamily)
MTSPPDDPVAATAAGPSVLDGDALEALFKDCAADLHGYLISLLGDRAGAEDVTAIAFERLYRQRARLDPRRGTPRAWLFAIARNAALDELRRRARRADASSVVHEDASTEPAAALEDVERRSVVREALARLPLREREIVLLKFHGQLSHAEIARALGISESSAGTRLHRALTRLRTGCSELDEREVA